MNKLYFSIIFLTVFTVINAQYAESNFELFKCNSSHLKSAYAPLSHPGLLKYDVKWYNIELEADNTSNYIKGFAEVLLEAKSDIDTVILELSNSLTIDSILKNTQSITYTFEGDLLQIPLPSTLNLGEKESITVFYNGSPTIQNQQAGVYSRNDPNTNQPVTYTLAEPFYAKMWFPCKQVLEDKADSVQVSIITADDLKAGSNGLLKKTETLANNKIKYTWNSNYPIAYYLISFSIADYTEYNIYAHPENTTDSILIQNYVYDIPGYLDNNKALIDNTADMLEYFSEIFTLYPFHEEKYGHCQAAFGGGMEHQTMTTLIDFRFFLVAHELAHQWFGDNVTCASWQDIWVNEGFASYAEYLAIEKLLSPNEAKSWMENCHYYALNAYDGSIYVPFEDVTDDSRIFNYYLSYKKGASILHMLRFELDDDELFFDILREFQTQHKDSVATGDDFNAVLNELSGEDYTYFLEQWYYGEGFPIYEINWLQENDTLYIYSKQQSSASVPQFYKSSLEFAINYSNDKDTIRVLQDEANKVFAIYAPKQITSLNFDPNDWLLKQIAASSNLDKQVLPGEYFEIYPNPVSQQLTVSLNYPGRDNTIELYSIDGKLVYKKNTRQPLVKINMAGLGNGAYFLVVKNNNERLYKKVLKVN